MEKLLMILLFFGSLAAAKAQDKIITINQDTIECRIVSVNAERISYEQKTSDKYVVGKSIATSDVLQYFRAGKSDSFGQMFNHEKVKRERPEHRWLFSMQGGLARSSTDYTDFKNGLISSGNSASAVDDYFRKLENGYHVNTSLHYLVTSFLGLGVDYNFFYSASKGMFLSQAYGKLSVPLYVNIGMDERLYSHFVGASFLFQQFPDKKRRIKISETLSPGIVMLRNESRDNQYTTYWGAPDYYNSQPPQYYDQTNSIVTGNTFGAKGSLSIEYALTPQLSAGLAGNFMRAKLKKISTKNSATITKDQKLEKSLNISHLDYGFIVRYNF